MPYQKKYKQKSGKAAAAFVRKKRAKPGYGGPRYGGLSNMELKFVDGQRTASVSNTWAGGEEDISTVDSLVGIQQGSATNEHEGNKYFVHSIMVQGEFNRQALEAQTAPGADIFLRLIMYMDTQTNGAQAQAEQVMEPISAGSDWKSFRKLENTARFKILKDKTFKLNQSAASMNEGASNLFATAGVCTPFNYYIKFPKPIKVRTITTGSNIASIADNSFHLICASSFTGPVIVYQTRCRFTA